MLEPILRYMSIDITVYLLYIKHTFLVWYPSGKGLVCKTIIGRFDSYPLLNTEGCLITRQPLVFASKYKLVKKRSSVYELLFYHPVEAKLRGDYIYGLVYLGQSFFFLRQAQEPRDKTGSGIPRT